MEGPKRAGKAVGELGRLRELLDVARNTGENAWVRVEAASVAAEEGRDDEAAPILVAIGHDASTEGGARWNAGLALKNAGQLAAAVSVWRSLDDDPTVDSRMREQARAQAEKIG
jgi:hypothetical protein